MGHYSNKPDQCRVDFFKPSGKWYTTEAFTWHGYSGTLLHDAFKLSLNAVFQGNFSGMTAVCLSPYHENEHPLMLPNWDNAPG